MMLTELDAKKILREHGIPINETRVANNAAEAVEAASQLRYPIVVKVLSKNITHKSDLGLVDLNIRTPEGVREAYERIVEKARSIDPDAKAVVESMAPNGTEVIVGAKRDPQFGPTILFGLGGIFVEVFKDVSLRIAPVDRQMALSMMKDIKGNVILEGYRGKKGIDKGSLADIVVDVSKLMMSRDDILELDINPVIAYEHGAVAVDARILLKSPSFDKI